jgi:antitoxin (DNA-binding transcriptional repressor) of toxin-antitoxin stability system
MAKEKIRVGAYKAKTNLPALLRGILDGYEYEITNRGVVIANLVSAQDEQREGMEEAIEQIKAFMKKKLGKGVNIKALIEEGAHMAVFCA